MDLCQSVGLELLWPFRTTRYSADWVPHLDLWILSILLAGILFPLLARLVTDEIGAKSKGPKGRFGATLALVVVFFYVGARAILHKGAIAELQSVTYRGESPRKVAAIAESSSLFVWHGIVETERALHDIAVDVGPNATFDPNSAFTSYKPESSPPLEAARNTDAARRFLAVARFPKATVEKTQDGYHVEIRGFPFRQDSRAGWRVMAVIDTDSNAKILNQEIVWDPASKETWWSNNAPPQSGKSSLFALNRFCMMPALQNDAR
jgi:hypothetical protein